MKTMTRNKKMGIRSVSIALLAVLSMLGALFVLPSPASASLTHFDVEFGIVKIAGGTMNELSVAIQDQNCPHTAFDSKGSGTAVGDISCTGITGSGILGAAEVDLACDDAEWDDWPVDTMSNITLPGCTMTITIDGDPDVICVLETDEPIILDDDNFLNGPTAGWWQEADVQDSFDTVEVTKDCPIGIAVVIDGLVASGVDLGLGFTFFDE